MVAVHGPEKASDEPMVVTAIEHAQKHIERWKNLDEMTNYWL